jgi:hypothetical protein
MKILLDESVPHKLRLLIEGGHTIATTWYMGWSGLKNGALLAAAEEAGFRLFVTADQEIQYQQNFSGRQIAVLVLGSNNWAVVKDNAGKITAAVDAVGPGTFTSVHLDVESDL